MKKFINAADKVVEEALQGFALAHSEIVTVHYAPHYLVRAKAQRSSKVTLVSGGGSGHEPLHSGYVGWGMLDAACPGAVFTSPTPDQIYAAAKEVGTDKGVLFIVKNYTGDILNFEMAADLLQADGIEVKMVVVDDDIAVKDSLYTAGRRGVAATVIVEKIAGAAAQAGLCLDEVASIAQRVNANSRTLGVALSSCTVPHVGKPSFELAEDEYELGIGIHGEPGRSREKMQPADGVVTKIMQALLPSVKEEIGYNSGDEFLLLVNGMGGTPLVELYILYRQAAAMAAQQGVAVARNLVGSFVTSLEMQGASITLTKLDAQLKELWDAPVKTAALRWGI